MKKEMLIENNHANITSETFTLHFINHYVVFVHVINDCRRMFCPQIIYN